MNVYLTRAGKQKIDQEYLNIDKEIMQTHKLMGESAQMDNDLRENPDFMALRFKAMYELPQKKKTLSELCQNAIIIEDMDEFKKFDGVTVIMGVTVTINFDGEKEIYHIVGTNEGDLQNNSISENSPIAQAILGKKVGETVQFRGMDITILSVAI